MCFLGVGEQLHSFIPFSPSAVFGDYIRRMVEKFCSTKRGGPKGLLATQFFIPFSTVAELFVFFIDEWLTPLATQKKSLRNCRITETLYLLFSCCNLFGVFIDDWLTHLQHGNCCPTIFFIPFFHTDS